MGTHTGAKLCVCCCCRPVAVCPRSLHSVSPSRSYLQASPSQSVIYILQMKESHWEAETLDKEGLSESVRSCESCPGV